MRGFFSVRVCMYIRNSCMGSSTGKGHSILGLNVRDGGNDIDLV